MFHICCNGKVNHVNLVCFWVCQNKYFIGAVFIPSNLVANTFGLCSRKLSLLWKFEPSCMRSNRFSGGRLGFVVTVHRVYWRTLLRGERCRDWKIFFCWKHIKIFLMFPQFWAIETRPCLAYNAFPFKLSTALNKSLARAVIELTPIMILFQL